jgi:hypothetical protein
MPFPLRPLLPPITDTARVLATIQWCVGAHVQRPATLYWLLDVLVRTTDALVRNQAALALADLRVQAAVPVLVDLLSAEATGRNRGSLLYALQELDYRDHLAVLADQFGSDVFEVLELTLQLFEHLPRRLRPRQTGPTLQRLAYWVEAVTHPDRTPYVQQALRLVQAVAHNSPASKQPVNAHSTS